MKTKLFNQLGEELSDITLPDKVFGLKVNTDLISEVLRIQLANSRKVLAHTKDRSEVRGGGKKPWRQKGTGRARHASIRSPIWKGGGVTFGPTKDRNFSRKVNKKTKRKALFMALSSKIQDKEFMVLDHIKLEKPKTKLAAESIKKFSPRLDGFRTSKNKSDSILLVIPSLNKELQVAFNNIKFANIISADSLNIRDVLVNKYLVLLKDSIPVIERTFNIK